MSKLKDISLEDNSIKNISEILVKNNSKKIFLINVICILFERNNFYKFGNILCFKFNNKKIKESELYEFVNLYNEN